MRYALRPVLALTSCFVLLQGIDFFFTWLLLEGGIRQDVYEANPVALAILSRHGWAALAGFKALCSLVALGAVLLACRYYGTVGLKLLALLCLIMGGVVGYSGVLLAQPTDSRMSLMVREESREVMLMHRIRHVQGFDRERTEICKKLLRGDLDLQAAMVQIRLCLQRYDLLLSAVEKQRLPDFTQPDQVASYLYHYSSRVAEGSPQLLPVLERIGSEMQQRYPSAVRVQRISANPLHLPVWSRTSSTPG